MPEEPGYNIADYLDPEREIRSDSDPEAVYLRYLADVEGGAVGDMGSQSRTFGPISNR
jgi:hypothetical protein